MISKISRLLRSVTNINENFDKMLKATGENFNIFQILKMETGEVKLHSAFIAELLNPYGSHGQNDIFLKAFMRTFKISGFEIDSEIKAVVVVEEYIGKVDIENGIGGRIDIVIKFDSSIIIIENKINASDENKQMVRYHNQYPNAHLIYLTLEGKQPEKYSIENNTTNEALEWNIDYFTASYKDDIIRWLIECRKQSTQHPLLRETISQYINLIKNLTGQTMNLEKENIIVDAITESGDAMRAAIEINGSLNRAKKKLLSELALVIKKKVNSEFETLQIEISPDFGDRFCGMKLSYSSGKVNYLLLSFAGHQSYPYLEIYNDENLNPISNKIEKKPENIEYYRKKLNSKYRTWGKIENVESSWHGDWVCRYEKLNRLNDINFWASFANQDYSLAEEISKDLMILLEIMR